LSSGAFDSASVAVISACPAGQTDRRAHFFAVETCAHLILPAAGKRQRELVMTWLGKPGPRLKLIAPGLVDHMARRAISVGR